MIFKAMEMNESIQIESGQRRNLASGGVRARKRDEKVAAREMR